MENTQNTNPYGFPVTECDRCDGTGEFSWNERDGKRCFKCNGQKFTIAKRAAKAWDAFQKAKDADAQRDINTIKVGDKIVWKFGTKWLACEVVEITKDELNGGRLCFTLSRGTTVSFSDAVKTCRVHNPEFDPTPFLAQIKEVK